MRIPQLISLALICSPAFGVQLVKDVNAVPLNGVPGGSRFSQAVETTGGVIFIAEDELHGAEPWVTDGTPAGTRMLKDIRPGPTSSEVNMVTAVDGIAMFMANDGVNGYEIWRTDGTTAGTRMVANIGPGAASGVGSVIVNERPFPVIGNIMYFNANDGVNGDELWRTDGTAAGTYRLTDGIAGSGGIQPQEFQVVGSRLYFLATDAEGEELWTSDGSVTGSRRVANINPSTDRHIGFLRAVGDVLFFEANEPATGSELWRADAAGNAARVTDMNSGPADSGPGVLGVIGNRLVFVATTNSGFNLLSISSTASSPTVLAPQSPDLEIQYLSEAPGGLLIQFRSRSSGFVPPAFLTDGTVSGTGYANSELRVMYGGESAVARDNSWLYFYGQEGLGAPANIYRTGGTAASTTLFATIANPAPIPDLKLLNGQLYFMNGRFNDPMNGNEVWRTDGTPLGTHLFADFTPGTADTRANLNVVGNRLFISVLDDASSYDPWASDGAAAPVLLADLNSGAETGNSLSTMLGVAGPYTLFSADDGINGTELWSTTGTSASTRMLTNLSDGITADFLQMDGYGLFVGNGALGAELWRSDGTVAGTMMVKDIAVGADSSYPELHTGVVLNGVAYFVATNNTYGGELWRSDGTDAGTWMVFETFPGPANQRPRVMGAANGRVFVRGAATSPPQVFATDGTAGNSVIVSNGANVGFDSFVFQDRLCVSELIVNTSFSEYFCSNGEAGNFTQVTNFEAAGVSPLGVPYPLGSVVVVSTNQGIHVFDGSGAPVVKISDWQFTTGTYIDNGSRLAFRVHGQAGDIVVTDGTAAGTRSMLAGSSVPLDQIHSNIVKGVDGSVLFNVVDPASGPALWKTDGTVAGTRFLFDVDPGNSLTGEAAGFLQVGDRVYFSAFRTGIGSEPWYFSTVSPNASDDYAETDFATSITIPVIENDSDFDSLLTAPGIEIVTPPANGTATIGTGVITYMPDTGFSGLDHFVYRVLDAQGNPSNAANVNVTTRADSSSVPPGTPPATPVPTPPPAGGGGGSSSSGGGGGALGWEAVFLALLLLARRLHGDQWRLRHFHRRATHRQPISAWARSSTTMSSPTRTRPASTT